MQMRKSGRKSRQGRQRLTAEQRAEFAKERQALCGKLLTQKGFEGALVIEHVRGSQYLLRLANGTEVYASHKKQRTLPTGALTRGGWKLWEDRQ